MGFYTHKMPLIKCLSKYDFDNQLLFYLLVKVNFDSWYRTDNFDKALDSILNKESVLKDLNKIEFSIDNISLQISEQQQLTDKRKFLEQIIDYLKKQKKKFKYQVLSEWVVLQPWSSSFIHMFVNKKKTFCKYLSIKSKS